MAKQKKTAIEKRWKEFNAIAEKYGYSIITHNDYGLGIGTICSKKDCLSPIIKLCIWPEVIDRTKTLIEPTTYSIHVKDRNGNNVLSGPLCAVYTLEEAKVSFDKEFNRVLTECEGFEEKFTRMCNDAFEKYSKYSRENRLDFIFNELEEERVEYF